MNEKEPLDYTPLWSFVMIIVSVVLFFLLGSKAIETQSTVWLVLTGLSGLSLIFFGWVFAKATGIFFGPWFRM